MEGGDIVVVVYSTLPLTGQGLELCCEERNENQAAKVKMRCNYTISDSAVEPPFPPSPPSEKKYRQLL